ncbi:unnamed protein product [Bemisia tabaci]|uniref:TGF-beta family profile domain-containing protein n=1 Tax=Bemisia tabaci TaxID=7038 RepID=A0A9P0ACL1_BEMTA|nr:unnamed protein product [Bemisia tabaci]
MHARLLLLAVCCLVVAGFRRGRADIEHIGKSYQFLAEEPARQVGQGADGRTAEEEAGWEAPDVEDPSVPLAMRLLAEAENETPRGRALRITGQEDFTPIAKSLSPDSVTVGTFRNLAVINFTVPNEYSRALGKNRTVWFILTLKNITQHPLVTAVLSDNLHYRGDVFVNSTRVDWNKNFLLFNVTKFVKYSYRNQSLSFSLVTQPEGDSRITVSDVVELQGSERGPLLVSTAFPELSAIDMPGALRSKSRRRRSAEAGEVTSSSSTRGTTTTATPVTSSSSPSCNCRLQEWAPSKEELGWSWLIRPEFVPINYCIGDCPVPLLNSTYNASSNAIARDYYRTIIKARDPKLDHPDIHCVPIAYRPVAVLIESAPGIISMERVSTLAVSQCGCR